MASPAGSRAQYDNASEADGLVSARSSRESAELAALLTPRAGSVTRSAGGKPQGLGPHRVRSAASLADAVIEERRH